MFKILSCDLEDDDAEDELDVFKLLVEQVEFVDVLALTVAEADDGAGQQTAVSIMFGNSSLSEYKCWFN